MSAHWVRSLAGVLITVALLGSLLAGCSLPASAHPVQAHAWRLVRQDQFTGRAGVPPSAASWLYDTGTGYGCAGCPASWGTGEVETMVKSTATVYLDGRGHLTIKPIRDATG